MAQNGDACEKIRGGDDGGVSDVLWHQLKCLEKSAGRLLYTSK